MFCLFSVSCSLKCFLVVVSVSLSLSFSLSIAVSFVALLVFSHLCFSIPTHPFDVHLKHVIVQICQSLCPSDSLTLFRSFVPLYRKSPPVCLSLHVCLGVYTYILISRELFMDASLSSLRLSPSYVCSQTFCFCLSLPLSLLVSPLPLSHCFPFCAPSSS